MLVTLRVVCNRLTLTMDFQTLRSGVSQGPILRPLLFVTFISEICDSFFCSFSLLIDGLEIFKLIKDTYDFSLVQKNIYQLSY